MSAAERVAAANPRLVVRMDSYYGVATGAWVSFTIFGSIFGGLIGGALGVLLGALLPITPWRHVPIGRLFVQLTLGTIIGGGLCATIIRHPLFAILGGIFAFVIAGDRLARRFPATLALQADERAE